MGIPTHCPPQATQWMQRLGSTWTLFGGLGLMAPVGQMKRISGTSHFATSASLTRGRSRWMPITPMSAVEPSPHWLTQAAMEIFSLAGYPSDWKSSQSPSEIALAMAGASVAANWQWIQPVQQTMLWKV